MAERPVVEVPDPALKRRAEPAGRPDGGLARDLVETMRSRPGCVGLAAVQIGVRKRAFCVDVSGHPQVTKRGWRHHGLMVLFDPELVEADGAEIRREGCLSVPDFTADVQRAVAVTVRGIDPRGREAVLATEGFEARAVQHELDHLDGMLILDRVASLGTDVFPRRTYR